MLVKLLIRAAEGAPLPPDGALSVELRDTTEVDAPSTVVAGVQFAGVCVDQGGLLAEVNLTVPEELVRERSVTAYARLGAPTDRPPRPGDLVTTQSAPVEGADPLELLLHPVR